MNDLGRNAPCACGSGRKYKVCCLRREQEYEQRRQRRVSGIKPALDWLYASHEAEVRRVIATDFFAVLGGGMELLENIPQSHWPMVDILLHEWLLAEARIRVPGPSGRRRLVFTHSLLLGADGMLMTAEQREEIEHMSQRAMSLYEVVAVRAGTGFDLRDLLFPDEPGFDVRDVALSRSLVRGDVFASRLVPFGDQWLSTGGVCTYSMQDRDEAMRAARDFIAEHGLTAESARFTTRDGMSLGRILRDAFILGLVESSTMPRIVDFRGDPVTLVNDHYEVLDADALERRLAGTHDVEGDREEGWEWLEPAEEGATFRRTRMTLHVDPVKNRLTAFTKTMRSADEGREWFVAIAGDAVRHQAREIADPRSPAVREAAGVARGGSDPLADMDPAERTNVFQQIYEQIYRNWGDEPIPALGNLTPRKAVLTVGGREKVSRLLTDYEVGEVRKARDENREPASFAFLWEAVGLKRP